MKKILFILCLSLTMFSCKDSKNVDTNENKSKSTSEIAQNLKSIEVNIEGMTCEIGCARLIQSKLSKVEGVAFTNVDFESKKGVFTFDSNKLSSNDISEKINKIAGGDLYSVTKTTELEKIVTKSKENIEISQ